MILTMVHFVVLHSCWIVVLNAHVCFKTCTVLQHQYLCHWSIYFHRSSQRQCWCKHWERLISCQGAQRQVWKNQQILESLSWFPDWWILDRKHCHRCTLNSAVSIVELRDVSILCSSNKRMLCCSFGNLVTMTMFTSCLCHSCILTMICFRYMNGVWLCTLANCPALYADR